MELSSMGFGRYPGTLFTDYGQLPDMPSESRSGESARQPRHARTGFGFFFAS